MEAVHVIGFNLSAASEMSFENVGDADAEVDADTDDERRTTASYHIGSGVA